MHTQTMNDDKDQDGFDQTPDVSANGTDDFTKKTFGRIGPSVRKDDWL